MKKIKSQRLFYFIKILPFISCNKLLSFLIIAFKLLSMVVLILTPFVYKYFINSVIMAKNLEKLQYVILSYIALFLLQSLSISFSNYYENKFTNLLRIKIKKKLLEIYTGMDFKDYEEKSTGDMRLRIEEDSNVAASFYINHCVNFFFSIAAALIMILIIIKMNWYLTLFGVLMIFIGFFISKVLAAKIKITSNKYRGSQGEFENSIQKTLKNWKEIKTNNLEESEEAKFSEKWSVLSKSLVKRTFYEYWYGALIAFNLSFVTRMSLYFFGGLLIMHKLMTVATMLVFMNYYEQIYTNVQTVTDLVVELSTDLPQLEGIFSALKYRNPRKSTGKLIGKVHDILYINNVSFSYGRSHDYVLKNISAKIPFNKKTAIAGKSGCGKSTLAKLLLGIYNPNEGEIYLGNTDINELNEASRNHVINAVMQDPIFFNMSILDNLLISKRNATMDDINNACKMANIYDFIKGTPKGYGTIIGESGIKLSGGQKQRLAIARTLLLDPEIIIFDEATSSLDSESENDIVKATEELSKYKTIISISHRFSTIAGSDNMIILQNGHIASQGSMEEMMKQHDLLDSIFHNINGQG